MLLPLYQILLLTRIEIGIISCKTKIFFGISLKLRKISVLEFIPVKITMGEDQEAALSSLECKFTFTKYLSYELSFLLYLNISSSSLPFLSCLRGGGKLCFRLMTIIYNSQS